MPELILEIAIQEERGERDSLAEETAHSKAWRGDTGWSVRRTAEPLLFLKWNEESREPPSLPPQDLGQEVAPDGE